MQSRRKNHWIGELKKPIRVSVVRPKGLAVTDVETVAKANEEMERLACEEINKQRFKKLHLLMDHYSIPNKDDWFSLAVALATDHVPGFQIEWPLVNLPLVVRRHRGRDREVFSGPVLAKQKKVGRPASWDAERLERLLEDVEREKTRHNLKTDRETLSRLAMRGEWSRPATHRSTLATWIETLESRLQDAKKLRQLLNRAETGLKAAITASNSGSSKRI